MEGVILEEKPTLIKDDLINAVARASNLPNAEAREIVEVILQSMIGALKSGQKIELRGFGTFRLKEKKPGIRLSPAGEEVNVPPKQVSCFKPGKDLLQSLNR